MEECVFHIKLMDWPVLGMSQGENSSDGGRLDDKAERLVIINVGVEGDDRHGGGQVRTPGLGVDCKI